MQPSTQVVHMPELGDIEPSVRFFVRVAADAFILESVMDIFFPPLSSSVLLDLTCHAGLHVTHHIIKLFFFDTGRAKISAATADRFVRLVVSAPQGAGRTDIHAATALSTYLRSHVERCAYAAGLTSAPETNRLGHHLLFAHSYTKPA